jgi:hypothetical protein
MSPIGANRTNRVGLMLSSTNRTNRVGLMLSAVGGRPEVGERVSKRRE